MIFIYNRSEKRFTLLLSFQLNKTQCPAFPDANSSAWPAVQGRYNLPGGAVFIEKYKHLIVQ